MKRVLVTGAAGFCGEYLGRALAERGFQVTGTYHKVSPPAEAFDRRIKIDLRSWSAVHQLIRTQRPHYLLHLAAQSSAQRSWNRQVETFAVNAGGTLNLLNAVRALSPATRILIVSSAQVYGRMFLQSKPVSEAGPVSPENPYASSKRTAELAGLNFFNRFGLDVLIARTVNHTGPGQDSHYVFSDWCRQIALAERSGRPGRLEVGNLRLKRDFLHVRDVANAYMTLLSKGRAGEIYNVASGRPLPLQKYADFLRRKAQVDFQIIPRQNRMRSSEPAQMRIDLSKIRRLGWKPSLSVFEALDDLLTDWREKIA